MWHKQRRDPHKYVWGNGSVTSRSTRDSTQQRKVVSRSLVIWLIILHTYIYTFLQITNLKQVFIKSTCPGLIYILHIEQPEQVI